MLNATLLAFTNARSSSKPTSPSYINSLACTTEPFGAALTVVKKLQIGYVLTFPSPWSIIGPMKIGASCVAFLTTLLFLYTIMVTNKELRLNVCLHLGQFIKKEYNRASTVTVSRQFDLECTG